MLSLVLVMLQSTCILPWSNKHLALFKQSVPCHAHVASVGCGLDVADLHRNEANK